MPDFENAHVLKDVGDAISELLVENKQLEKALKSACACFADEINEHVSPLEKLDGEWWMNYFMERAKEDVSV